MDTPRAREVAGADPAGSPSDEVARRTSSVGLRIRSRLRVGKGYNVTNFVLDLEGEMAGHLN